jgi:antagonist of KipI
MLTTIQDRGRFGCAMLGVGRAGPMDDVAMRLANALVGNAAGAAVLEITLVGPRLRFDAATTIAFAGAEFPNVASWRPIHVEAGAVVDVGTARHGARACLAIAGGFAAEPTLGSVAIDVNSGIGGRPLREGDRLSTRANERAIARYARWSLDPRPWFDADATHAVRLLRSAHFDLLDAASRDALFTQTFRVGKDSNRVGFRLDGPTLALSAQFELVSEPLAIGALQLPPGGAPIALMAEHPTVGGYPRIGQIAAVDLPRLAQRRPGDLVRFAEIDLDRAQTRYLERERELAKLVEAIGERLHR